MKGIFKYQTGGKSEKINKIQASLGLPQTGVWNPQTESKYRQKMQETGLSNVELAETLNQPQNQTQSSNKSTTYKKSNPVTVNSDYEDYVSKVGDLKKLEGKEYRLPSNFRNSEQQNTCIGGACAAIRTVLPSFPQEYSNPDFLRKINNDEIKGISKITNTKDLTKGDLLQFGERRKLDNGKEISHPSHASLIVDEGVDDFHGAYVEVLDTSGREQYKLKRYYKDKNGNITLPSGYNSLTGFRPDNEYYKSKSKDKKFISQKNSLQKGFPDTVELYKAKIPVNQLQKVNETITTQGIRGGDTVQSKDNKSQVINPIVEYTNKNRIQLMKDLGISTVEELNELTKKSIGIIGRETEFGSPSTPIRWMKHKGEEIASKFTDYGKGRNDETFPMLKPLFNIIGGGGTPTTGLSEININNIPEVIRKKYNINTPKDLYDPVKANIANIAIMQINRDTSVAKRDMDKAAGMHNDYYGVKANTPKAQAYIKGVNEQSDYKNYKEPSLLERTQRFFGFKKGGIHIKPENKGKFNATKKRTGKTTEELTHSKNPVTKKRAVFAQNAKKWKHEKGGMFLYQVNLIKQG